METNIILLVSVKEDSKNYIPFEAYEDADTLRKDFTQRNLLRSYEIEELLENGSVTTNDNLFEKEVSYQVENIGFKR